MCSESGLPQYEFTEFHSGLKLGDVVGIIGLPGLYLFMFYVVVLVLVLKKVMLKA